MPLQLEAFLPFVIIGGALCAAAPILNYTHRYFNKGKPLRTMMDQWDKAMVERDIRLTGDKNVQRDPCNGIDG